MSKHTISMDDATWDAMVERAGRIGLDRDGRALSVSAYIRELHQRYGKSFELAAPGERKPDNLPSVDDVIGILGTDTDWQPPEVLRCIARGTHNDRHGPCVECVGDTYEQSTRADAQPTGQGGSATEPVLAAPLVQGDGTTAKQPSRKKGIAHADPAREDLTRGSAALAAGRFLPCRRVGCTAPALPNSGYCSASHRLADEQEKRR